MSVYGECLRPALAYRHFFSRSVCVCSCWCMCVDSDQTNYPWHMICYCCVAIAHGRDPKAQPEGVKVETTRDGQGGKNRKQ